MATTVNAISQAITDPSGNISIDTSGDLAITIGGSLFYGSITIGSGGSAVNISSVEGGDVTIGTAAFSTLYVPCNANFERSFNANDTTGFTTNIGYGGSASGPVEIGNSTGGITTYFGAGVVTSTSGGVLGVSTGVVSKYTPETSGTVALLSGQGFIANKSTLTTLTLPSTSAVGDVISVVGQGSGGWKIAQNSGNQIVFGSATSTSGTGGSISSNLQYDCVDLICLTASALWSVKSSVGNLTVT